MFAITYTAISLVIALISGYFLYIQSKKRTRIILFLILLWIICSTIMNVYNYLGTRPKAALVLEGIEQHYDLNPPKSVLFLVVLRNTGNEKATNVVTEPVIFYDDEVLYQEKTKQPDINPGQPVRLRIGLTGDKFQRVWNGKAKLKLRLTGSFSGGTIDTTAEYETNKDEFPIVIPGWKIIR